MVFTGTISPEKRALGVFLRTERNASFREIALKCGISKSSAQRLCTNISCPRKERAQVQKKGRPRKVCERDMRVIIRTLKRLRETNVNFTVKQLVHESGVDFTGASERTFSRRLNEKGYKFLVARKKGLVTYKDCMARLSYARKMKRVHGSNPDFWKHGVAFYMDGVSFIHKTNPMSAAASPKARALK